MNPLRKIYRKLFAKAPIDADEQIKTEWERAGRPSPPPHRIKQLAISDIQTRSKYDLLIETGTYLGDMVEAQKNNFARIYSIELGNDLFTAAVDRFKDQQNITILNGDSSDVLVEIADKINEPAIFWLDGHYSGGVTAMGKKSCPIYEELTAIFAAKALDHIILIDDARLFIGEDDYPTVEELTAFVKAQRPSARIWIDSDIIHIYLTEQ